MHIPKRDVIATGFVALAVVLYLLWVADAAVGAMSDVRVTGVVVLACGFVASAVAVVPGFDQLLHGGRTYLLVTALLGVVALAAGIQMLVSGSGAGMGVLMSAMVLLWAIASVHHLLLAKTEHPERKHLAGRA